MGGAETKKTKTFFEDRPKLERFEPRLDSSTSATELRLFFSCAHILACTSVLFFFSNESQKMMRSRRLCHRHVAVWQCNMLLCDNTACYCVRQYTSLVLFCVVFDANTNITTHIYQCISTSAHAHDHACTTHTHNAHEHAHAHARAHAHTHIHDITLFEMTHSHVWHDSSIPVTWLINNTLTHAHTRACQQTYTCIQVHIYVWGRHVQQCSNVPTLWGWCVCVCMCVCVFVCVSV